MVRREVLQHIVAKHIPYGGLVMCNLDGVAARHGPRCPNDRSEIFLIGTYLKCGNRTRLLKCDDGTSAGGVDAPDSEGCPQ
jgi:hypothetical protein